MALVDDIERLGRAVEANEISRDEAVSELVEISGGGLAVTGAAGLIDGGWRTARASYEQSHNRAWHAVKSIENGRRPHPEAR